MTIPGDYLTEWIYTKVTEFTAYEAELVTYNKKRKEFNAALRLEGKQTTISYSYVDSLLPAATTATLSYTKPTLTHQPWHPTQYAGPQIKQGDASVDIDVGFGSPTVYMYTLKTGNGIDPEYRSFGSMGTTTATGYGVRLDHTSGERFGDCVEGRYSYMALTLLPVAGYVQATNSERLNITVGAYDWRSDTYLTPTDLPAAPVDPHTEYQLGAHSLQTAVVSTLMALTFAQFV